MVDTSLFTKFIVSYIAIPDVTDPPGELIYKLISSLFNESRYNNCAITEFAHSSSISPLRSMILSFNNLEKIS